MLLQDFAARIIGRQPIGKLIATAIGAARKRQDKRIGPYVPQPGTASVGGDDLAGRSKPFGKLKAGLDLGGRQWLLIEERERNVARGMLLGPGQGVLAANVGGV